MIFPLPRDRVHQFGLVEISCLPADITMLRSVVTTGSYTIEKYSRSYPSPPVHTQSQDVGAVQPEWQHFSNPVITLKLDVKKAMDNDFESVRLRVLWIMDTGHDGVEREITMV